MDESITATVGRASAYRASLVMVQYVLVRHHTPCEPPHYAIS
jgi:hypothetical protein